MRIRFVALACLVSMLAARQLPASSPELAARFDAAGATHVPGVTLPKGTFAIKVISHAGERYILRVEDQAHDSLATFLAVPNATLATASTSGRVDWPTPVGGATNLRGWYFPAAHTGLEFVYPKAEAVALAQANKARVIAIDPESDGIAAGGTTRLTMDQMIAVTMWSLSLTHAGPDGTPGTIAAERYTQVASAAHKPALQRLPHTASDAPWIAALGLLSLLTAGGMRVWAAQRGREVRSA